MAFQVDNRGVVTRVEDKPKATREERFYGRDCPYCYRPGQQAMYHGPECQERWRERHKKRGD